MLIGDMFVANAMSSRSRSRLVVLTSRVTGLSTMVLT